MLTCISPKRDLAKELGTHTYVAASIVDDKVVVTSYLSPKVYTQS